MGRILLVDDQVESLRPLEKLLTLDGFRPVEPLVIHRHHGRAPLRGKVRHGIAHPVHPTALVRGMEDPGRRGPQPLVVIGNHQSCLVTMFHVEHSLDCQRSGPGDAYAGD